VIWAEYRSEIDRICAAFGGVHLDGRTSHDAERIVADFQAGRTPRLVCHPQAAGHGITLTRACYAIYFSLSFSLELFEQSRARLDRSGQTRPVTNYILCSDETIDRAIWRVIQSKGNVQREVLNAIREGRSIESVRG
jgi:SNF2 family DNA or RNA helicase